MQEFYPVKSRNFNLDRAVLRHPEFTKLSKSAILLWLNMQHYAALRDGRVFCAQATMAEQIGVSDRMVRKALAELRETGLIREQGHKNGAAIFRLYIPPWPGLFRDLPQEPPTDPELLFRASGTFVPPIRNSSSADPDLQFLQEVHREDHIEGRGEGAVFSSKSGTKEVTTDGEQGAFSDPLPVIKDLVRRFQG